MEITPGTKNEKVYYVNFEAEDGREIYKTVCEIIGIAALRLDKKAEISAQENIAAVLQNMLDANISDRNAINVLIVDVLVVPLKV